MPVARINPPRVRASRSCELHHLRLCKLKGWLAKLACVPGGPAPSHTQCHSFIGDRGAGCLVSFWNSLKDSIYRLWKHLHRMFISLRHSAPNSLALVRLCPGAVSGHLMAWAGMLSTFPRLLSGGRITLKNPTNTQTVFGVSYFMKSGCLQSGGLYSSDRAFLPLLRGHRAPLMPRTIPSLPRDLAPRLGSNLPIDSLLGK